jgi:hypothetical protein
MGQVYYALNAQAGLARLANRQGDPGSALECARTIWSALAGKSTEATVETALTLRTCYEIFSEHQDPLAAEVLSTACSQLRQRASTIDEQETLDHFWRLPDHRFFQEAAAGPNTRR